MPNLALEIKEPAWIKCPKCQKETSKLDQASGFCWDCNREEQKNAESESRLVKILGAKAARDFTFPTFIQTVDNRAAFEFCNNFNYKSNNLYLWGPAGTGKTHLAYAIAQGAVRCGLRVGVYKCPDLMLEFQATPADHQKAVLRDLVNDDILILDDVGIERSTENSNKVLYQIIDSRIMALKNGLILTANLSLDELSAKMGDVRVGDRLSGICDFLRLDGDSWRRKLRTQ